MSLSSLQLDAFMAVVRTHNFSRAAESLFITQSALSQRVKNLEGELGAAVFIRDPAGIRITEVGERLLRYCQVKEAMKAELLYNLTPGDEGDLAGLIRIGAFSSILRTVVIPSLATLLRDNPRFQCDFVHREVQGLPTLLERAEVDFIIMDYPMNQPSIEQHVLGYEEYVVIESAEFPTPEHVFLDNAPDDPATENFFAHHYKGKDDVPDYRRLFMGETFGILAGVAQGLGRAVMPVHLVKDRKELCIVQGFAEYRRAITLHFHKQSYYPLIHSRVVEELERNSAMVLGQ